MHPRVRRAAIALGIAAASLAMPAPATGLQVAPTTIDVVADRASAALDLRNTGEHDLHAQVRVFAWHVEDDRDVLAPTDAIAASPPLLKIAPGASQLVRIVRSGDAPADREAAYRIVVDELPVDGDAAAGEDGLRFVLRYSVPVFLQPRGARPTAPVLDTRIEDAGGARRLVVENAGDGRAQVADLAYVAADGRRSVIAGGLAGYVLPGSRRGWTMPAEGRGGRVVARINGETAERTLAADPVPR